MAGIGRAFNMKYSNKNNSRSKETVRPGNLKRTIDISRYAGVLVIISIVGVYGLVRVLWPQNDAAQVKFVETETDAAADKPPLSEQQLKAPFFGPEYETAIRLREASALGMAISLSVVSISNRSGRVPNDVIEIGNYLNAAKLLPPGIVLSDGSIASERSTFHLAYRRDPLSFEVLASPNTQEGTQLLFRFPLPNSEPNAILYFEAFRDQPKPAPLLTTEQLSASGWRIRHWRGDVLSLNTPTLEALRELSDLSKAN